MKKIARLVLGLGVAMLVLSLLPSEKAASADSYGTSSDTGAVIAAGAVGVIGAYAILESLSAPPPPAKTPTPAQ